jgi:hypothetical protein
MANEQMWKLTGDPRYLQDDLSPESWGNDFSSYIPQQQTPQQQTSLQPIAPSFSSPTVANDAVAIAKAQAEYTSRQLSSVEEARKLGELTGTLTSKELAMFDEMESAAVTNLKSQVNEQTQDIWNTALADLVNKGVLQGTVGSRILGEIGGDAIQKIAEGVNNIRISKNTGILSAVEASKNRTATSMNLDKSLLTQKYGWDLDAQTKLAVAGTQADASKTASQYGLAGNLGLGVAGLAAKTLSSDWWSNLGKVSNNYTGPGYSGVDGSSWSTDSSEASYDWDWTSSY